VLTTMCRAAAPLLPLTLEEIYKGLTGEESVHLAKFPDVSKFCDTNLDNQLLLLHMDRIRDVCNTALAMRNKINIRVRQPLTSLIIVSKTWRKPQDADGLALLTLVEDEVNVKEVKYEADIDGYATLKLSLNNPVLGKRVPEKMKQIIPASKKGEWKQLSDGGVEICGEKLLHGEYTLQLEPKPEYKDRAQALSTNDALVILDTTVTPELEAEGIARDVVRMVQQARKDANLNVSDRIRLHLDAPEAVASAVSAHRQYLMEQTLSVELSETKLEKPAFLAENTLDDQKIIISLALAA
ncbi:MAG: class I tRNA ligase family protein, partial [Pseudomonadota bacterium]|nr:class I tRNA ligase family protein [Pseudomonadota bacterium]